MAAGSRQTTMPSFSSASLLPLSSATSNIRFLAQENTHEMMRAMSDMIDATDKEERRKLPNTLLLIVRVLAR